MKRRRPKPSLRALQRQQQGIGFAPLVRALPRLLRSVGPKFAHLTRGVQKTTPKVTRRIRGRVKKVTTKKNLKRVATGAAVAAGTGAISGAA